MTKIDNTNTMCNAMLRAGIDKPSSIAGREFCTEHCPYSSCILYDVKEKVLKPERSVLPKSTVQVPNVSKRIKELDALGMTIDKIARQTGASYKTIARVLVPS